MEKKAKKQPVADDAPAETDVGAELMIEEHSVDSAVSMGIMGRTVVSTLGVSEGEVAEVATDQGGPKLATLNRWRYIGRTLAVSLLALVILVVGAVAAEVLTGRWQATPIVSGSMAPKLPVGSIAFSQRIPLRNLKVGDIAVLHPPFSANVTYVHQIVKLRRRDGRVIVNTKGIANKIDDPWTVVVRGSQVYVVRGEIPLVGFVVSWVRTPRGHELVLMGSGLLSLALVASVMSDALVDRRRRRRGRGESPRVDQQFHD